MTTPTTTSTSRKRTLIAVAIVVLVALAGGIWYVFIRDDSPAAFDIDSAAEGASDVGDTGEDSATAGNDFDGNVEGTWIVDPSLGAASGGSSAGFRVDEELATIGATTAVGRTEGVTGSLVIEGTAVTAGEFVVDMASLQTDDSRRDNRMRSALATDQFPTATFVLLEPIELGSIPEEGETITVTAVGEMTIKGTANSAEIELDARLVDGTLVVVGSAPVVFADYGVDPPSAPIVVSVADNGTIEFQLFLAEQ